MNGSGLTYSGSKNTQIQLNYRVNKENKSCLANSNNKANKYAIETA
jgi:hypothetical protein